MCICSFYGPPGSDVYPIIQLNESFSKLQLTVLNGETSLPFVLITGGFNFPDIAWTDGCGTVKPNPADACELNLFLDVINDSNLEQFVYKPTRNKNILYLVFGTYPAFIDVSVIPGISDHDTVPEGIQYSSAPKTVT